MRERECRKIVMQIPRPQMPTNNLASVKVASRSWWKNRKGVFSRYPKTITGSGESQTEEEYAYEERYPIR
jgi:hypothetical protein